MRIALLGYGTVGRGVDSIIQSRVGDVQVTRILELPDRLSDPRMTADFAVIENDPTIDLVVECMGGIEPARGFIARSLEAGKHVVTSNKAVVAAHLSEFAQIAARKDVAFLIEAAVAGGIPWIASIDKVRRIDEVTSFWGIMNGTTNFVIESMRQEGLEFAEALRQAQVLGYAEADPTADIDGIDVANKTIISSRVAFDAQCPEDLPVTGIRTLAAADIRLAAKRGLALKLYGRGVCRDGAFAAAVEPVALPLDAPEAAVPSNFNLVSLEGTTVGPLKFYGQGAGSLPTGNAIVQDVLDVADGRRQQYPCEDTLRWDPSLLAGDYLYRSALAPEGAVAQEDGTWVVRGITPDEARRRLELVWEQDDTAFMAALLGRA